MTTRAYTYEREDKEEESKHNNEWKLARVQLSSVICIAKVPAFCIKIFFALYLSSV